MRQEQNSTRLNGTVAQHPFVNVYVLFVSCNQLGDILGGGQHGDWGYKK